MTENSPLREQHVQAGASAFNDRGLPIDFGDPASEFNASINGAALFDCGRRCTIQVTGDDRAKFLHNFCTNEIQKLASGAGCEAIVTNVKGRILAHVFIYATDDTHWLDTTYGMQETLFPHLDRYIITEDVTLTDLSDERHALYISGKQAGQQLSKLEISADKIPAQGQQSVSIDTVECLLRQVNLTADTGFQLLVPVKEVGSVWDKLTKAGLQPAGDAVFEARRIAAGVPIYGRDVSDDNIAQEASRTNQAISFVKGCYLGQEPIARLDALGHVNRELCSLQFNTSHTVPEIGASIFADADQQQSLGEITSAAQTYPDEHPIALAMLRKTHSAPGTVVCVGGEAEATVLDQ